MTTDFAERADPYRRELLAYCYRMLGSIHDAEDLVQETYLRAWRAHDDFDERRASLRTWLYRIATNACLTALEGRGRRPLPSGLAGPGEPVGEHLDWDSKIPWLQPFPGDPATAAESRESIRIAFVAALQHLPARQRAVLILRDVLAWRAAEVAALLDTTPAGVNSALQRARTQLADLTPAEVAEPPEAERRAVLDRYVTAFVNGDMGALTELLREDIRIEMPPYPMWFSGLGPVCAFLGPRVRPGRWRSLPVRVNGEPGMAGYLRRDDGLFRAHSLQVLTITKTGIAAITAFQEPELFGVFGLPPTVS
ncbi:sigma-70 family RNA polymerase sigma factor [Amycolatopsis acidiphila]|uniref:RNA polymerase sigma factor n=1 Tax=Amycolatopsis acidiphila TaxID=715473 RepID=A0A557ZY55_9PSEU|nr:sigma-70 family RNA polymerase sigma factor [Amycolatopsis acidiphila]TVT16921.1 sigma-70 family RNA polymerase sigma factor [Amycolatopsis acidiphila]UIJ62090.1 sigma-70 family RNA polymerase sigma factor [Amycolatopsis acidiphila]GHG91816.1 RNA polymerase sigma factor [Amycolatopsis acidiphila]